MKVGFFEHESWMEEFVKERLPGHEVVFVSEPLTSGNAAKFADLEAVSVFVFSRIDKDVLETLPNLKLIAARSTGYDHIDTEETKKRGIVVTNVPKYGSVTVAEHTWALILAISRKIFESFERTEKGKFGVEGLRGFDLAGKTLGLVGLGEIGRNVARIGRGFGMKLRIFNRSRDEELARSLGECVYVDRIEDLFSHSDVISFHVPLAKETVHMLNLENVNSIKNGAVIINTARGQVIQTRALIKGLDEGIIGGAGLDVLEAEGTIKAGSKIDWDHLPNEMELAETVMNHILLDMDNVIVTPHNAFNSVESIERLVEANLEQMVLFGEGKNELMSVVG